MSLTSLLTFFKPDPYSYDRAVITPSLSSLAGQGNAHTLGTYASLFYEPARSIRELMSPGASYFECRLEAQSSPDFLRHPQVTVAGSIHSTPVSHLFSKLCGKLEITLSSISSVDLLLVPRRFVMMSPSLSKLSTIKRGQVNTLTAATLIFLPNNILFFRYLNSHNTIPF